MAGTVTMTVKARAGVWQGHLAATVTNAASRCIRSMLQKLCTKATLIFKLNIFFQSKSSIYVNVTTTTCPPLLRFGL